MAEFLDKDFFKRQGKEVKEILNEKQATVEGTGFKTAIKVLKKYDEYNQSHPKAAFTNYLHNLVTYGELKDTYNDTTLFLICNVLNVFDDLHSSENRLLSFDAYREIANAKLTDQQKKDLREESEEYYYSGRKVRNKVRQWQGIIVEGVIPKLKISEIGSNGDTILSELLNNEIIEAVTGLEVRLKPGLDLDKHKSRVEKIAKADFDRVWDILQQAKVRTPSRKGFTFKDNDQLIREVNTILEDKKPIKGDKFIVIHQPLSEKEREKVSS